MLTQLGGAAPLKVMPEFIDRSEGRRLFGLDPEGYRDVRPEVARTQFAGRVERNMTSVIYLARRKEL